MSTGDHSSQDSFTNRLAAVEQRILAAVQKCGRQRSEITLVAVSKKFSAAKIEEAYRGGCREFGENYVQEFADKRVDLSTLPGARFHLIGHLQSNKAKLACEVFDVVETVDSAKLLKRLDGFAEEQGRQIEAMLEVKLSEEENKSGCDATEIANLVDAASGCRHVTLSGLMTIPPWSEDAELSRPYFRKLTELARLNRLPKISMGMSNDLEVAIEEGATVVRIGTALFGPRPKPVPQMQK